MKMKEDIANQIRYLIESEPGRKWHEREIGDILGFRGPRARKMKGALCALVEEGVIRTVGKGVYAIANENLATGRIDIVRSGVGFVTDDKTAATYRVEARDIGDALPGDIVEVRVLRAGTAEARARVVRVKSRSRRLIVGTFYSVRGRSFAVPLDPAFHGDIEIADPAGAKNADRVVMRVSFAGNGGEGTGEIVEVIGPASNPSLDTGVVCRQYDLPGAFPAEVIDEASRAGERLDNPGDRLDLRDKFIFTIDPASARDYDDAISLDISPDGTRTLGVHIADVSFFVPEGSALDVEASNRGTSVYLVDKVIPMLPEQLSNGVCSLRPDEDRLTMSVFMDFDQNGRMKARRFARSVIRSRLRLTYEQALAIIEGRDAAAPQDVSALLGECARLAMQLRTTRMKDGALDLDIPECEISLDASGRMTDVKVREYDISHQMIEECMVAANEAVAAELSSRGIRILSRLHEPPDPTKIEDLRDSLLSMGFRPGDIRQPRNLSAFIASVADHPLKGVVHTLILRSMKRALYSSEGAGHFGLAKHFYSHFTSPIRRYPDLILHRQLAAWLTEGKGRMSPAYLRKMAVKCTELEKRADDAERALLEIKKYRFLKQVLDDGEAREFDAIVSKVTDFGLFVDLCDLQVGGLVHISSISSGFVRHNRASGTLSAGGRTWKLGDRVKVVVASVNFLERKLDFALAGSPEPLASKAPRYAAPRRQESYPKRKRQKRR